jgi:hypothetical protein
MNQSQSQQTSVVLLNIRRRSYKQQPPTGLCVLLLNKGTCLNCAVFFYVCKLQQQRRQAYSISNYSLENLLHTGPASYTLSKLSSPDCKRATRCAPKIKKQKEDAYHTTNKTHLPPQALILKSQFAGLVLIPLSLVSRSVAAQDAE